jgi:hypothetical protein
MAPTLLRKIQSPLVFFRKILYPLNSVYSTYFIHKRISTRWKFARIQGPLNIFPENPVTICILVRRILDQLNSAPENPTTLNITLKNPGPSEYCSGDLKPTDYYSGGSRGI